MILELIFIVSIVIFSIRSVLFLIGNKRENNEQKIEKKPDELPFVSVIIPARNEETNIERSITSLSESSYPKDKFEIIVVNDRSNDRTAEVLAFLKSKVDNLTVLNVDPNGSYKNLKGKPRALQTGFDCAHGEIILMSDADCTFPKEWIGEMILAYTDPKVGIAASLTRVEYSSIFEKMQYVEWIYMHTMARGGIGIHQPMGCWGNNLSVRRSVLEEIGGYTKIKFSITEDLALLQAVLARGYKARYERKPETLVATAPCTTVKEYLRQRHRWAVGGMALKMRAVFFVLSAVVLWIGIFAATFSQNFLWLAIILGSRTLLDLVLINTSMKILKLKKCGLFIIPEVFFFLLVELIAPFLLLKRNIEWKEQVFSTKA